MSRKLKRACTCGRQRYPIAVIRCQWRCSKPGLGANAIDSDLRPASSMPVTGRHWHPAGRARCHSKGQFKMPRPTLPRYLAKVPCHGGTAAKQRPLICHCGFNTGDGLDQRRADRHDASTQATSLIQSKAERTFRTGLCRPVLTSHLSQNNRGRRVPEKADQVPGAVTSQCRIVTRFFLNWGSFFFTVHQDLVRDLE
jgi:hypothetical protein